MLLQVWDGTAVCKFVDVKHIAVLKKVRYALCPMPYALCPMPYAQSYLIFLRKAISM